MIGLSAIFLVPWLNDEAEDEADAAYNEIEMYKISLFYALYFEPCLR